MVDEAGLVSQSNIRIVPETHYGTDPLDIMLCRSANEAARELFLMNENPPSKKPKKSEGGNDDAGDDDDDENDKLMSLVNASLYPDRHLPPTKSIIQSGDLVVVFESFNELNFVYAKKGGIFSNRNGHFHHNDFLGRPYGCKIRSRNNSGYGYLYLLRPTPELWASSLPHRTQIIHELDASMVCYYLDLTPGMIVCESGTGSGAMSHALARGIAPRGKLHTYEFNKVRALTARKEFREHGLGHLVQVHHRDVCGIGDAAIEPSSDDEETDGAAAADIKGEEEEDEPDDGTGGFNLPAGTKAHAIFLDLPQPWLAVPHAAHSIVCAGKIGSYSPCVEQTQRTVKALTRSGFHSIRTVEVRLMEYFVDEVGIESVPTEILDLPDVGGAFGVPAVAGGDGGDKEGEEVPTAGVKRKKKEAEKTLSRNALCARPFPSMRGHTAFLTFATAGIALQPDPNAVVAPVEKEA